VLDAVGRGTCFGSDRDGRPLADGFAGLPDLVQIEAARFSSCALERSGRVFCFGNEDVTSLPVLEPVPTLSGIEAIAMSAFTVCGLTGGRVICAGCNLGDLIPGAPEITLCDPSVFASREMPRSRIRNVGLNEVAEIQAYHEHASGDVVCWGQGDQGQLGTGGIEDATRPGDEAERVPDLSSP
jgi:alpha-tubulin suppressor-like RCC1 family protein